jgi:hypothetical protein
MKAQQSFEVDADLIQPMPDAFLPALDGYEKEIIAITNRIMKDERLGSTREEQFNTRVSFLGAMASRIVGAGALQLFEKIEETVPELTSREQLGNAFGIMVTDVMHRSGCLARQFDEDGEFDSVEKTMAERKKDVDNASVTH